MYLLLIKFEWKTCSIETSLDLFRSFNVFVFFKKENSKIRIIPASRPQFLKRDIILFSKSLCKTLLFTLRWNMLPYQFIFKDKWIKIVFRLTLTNLLVTLLRVLVSPLKGRNLIYIQRWCKWVDVNIYKFQLWRAVPCCYGGKIRKHVDVASILKK